MDGDFSLAHNATYLHTCVCDCPVFKKGELFTVDNHCCVCTRTAKKGLVYIEANSLLAEIDPTSYLTKISCKPPKDPENMRLTKREDTNYGVMLTVKQHAKLYRIFYDQKTQKLEVTNSVRRPGALTKRGKKAYRTWRERCKNL